MGVIILFSKDNIKFYAMIILRYIISNFLLLIIYYAIFIVISQIWREYFYIDDITNPRYAIKQMIEIIMSLASFIVFLGQSLFLCDCKVRVPVLSSHKKAR